MGCVSGKKKAVRTQEWKIYWIKEPGEQDSGSEYIGSEHSNSEMGIKVGEWARAHSLAGVPEVVNNPINFFFFKTR